jgi:ATP-binding cassette subfamily F protein uup
VPLVTVEQASLAFGDAALLDNADLTLDSGERVALIGRNGSGKTSLLKAIAGEQSLDQGNIWRAPGVRIAFVPQEPQLESTHTVFEAVASGLGPLQAVLTAYHKASHDVAAGEAGAF